MYLGIVRLERRLPGLLSLHIEDATAVDRILESVRILESLYQGI